MWPRELAALVHDESAFLVNQALPSAIADGENIVIDGTLSNSGRATRIADDLAREGYVIQVVSVEAAQHVTSERIAERWRNDHLDAEAGTANDQDTARLGGRWVPSEIVADLYDNPEESRCRSVATHVAQSQAAVQRYSEFNVAAVDGAPTPTTRLARAHSGAALTDRSTAQAARVAGRMNPQHASRRPGPTAGPER